MAVSRGADVGFLSCFPAEEESLFPPLTYLQPTGRTQMVTVGNNTFKVGLASTAFSSGDGAWMTHTRILADESHDRLMWRHVQVVECEPHLP